MSRCIPDSCIIVHPPPRSSPSPDSVASQDTKDADRALPETRVSFPAGKGTDLTPTAGLVLLQKLSTSTSHVTALLHLSHILQKSKG